MQQFLSLRNHRWKISQALDCISTLLLSIKYSCVAFPCTESHYSKWIQQGPNVTESIFSILLMTDTHHLAKRVRYEVSVVSCGLVDYRTSSTLVQVMAWCHAETMLTNHQWAVVAFTREQFHRKWQEKISLEIANSRLEPFFSRATELRCDLCSTSESIHQAIWNSVLWLTML